MDMNVIDIGSLVAILGLLLKSMHDKSKAAEEMGALKQQVKSLEKRADRWDLKFESIEDKLEKLVASMSRVEALMGSSSTPLQTPSPLKR
jgi:predicted  nucleic acid-binding Zn-ribbon protein